MLSHTPKKRKHPITGIACLFHFLSHSLLVFPEVSPLNFELFEAELTLYPDRAKANFVLQGIKEGFILGCNKQRSKLIFSISRLLATFIFKMVANGKFRSPKIVVSVTQDTSCYLHEGATAERCVRK